MRTKTDRWYVGPGEDIDAPWVVILACDNYAEACRQEAAIRRSMLEGVVVTVRPTKA